MFVLIVVILILIYVIVFNGVFFLTAALFSSITTLPVPGRDSSGSYDGLLIVLGIKPGACNLGGYSFDAYNLPI